MCHSGRENRLRSNYKSCFFNESGFLVVKYFAEAILVFKRAKIKKYKPELFMCTALIYRDAEKKCCFLGFNRDESVKRKKALSPCVESANGVEVICPKDGDYGGTWIGANSKREVYAILNFYEAQLKLIRNPISRGLLLRSLLFNEIALSDIASQDLGKYYPFRILKVTHSSTVLFEWDGDKIRISESSDKWQIFGSSFTMGKRAEVERRKTFEDKFLSGLGSWENIEDVAAGFLTSHLPEIGPLSPCMHRREARTISQTFLKLEGDAIYMKYKNSPPCEIEEFESYSMPINGHEW